MHKLIIKSYGIIYQVEEDNKQLNIVRFWHASRLRA
ncbi:type II toxin-antitoxin system RelE/ParE family toxin [Nostoc sp.]